MRDVYVQIHILVTLEDIIHAGRSHHFVVIGLLCLQFATWLLTRRKAAFCVNISAVSAASDKQRNGVVCIYVFLFMFALSGCVSVCRLCTIRDTGC